MRFRFRKFYLLAILLLIIGIFFLPFKVPFSFRSTGFVFPVKKWSVKTDLNGNYESELRNLRSGAIEDLTSYKFDRGDIARLSLLPNLLNNTFVKEGDTLGYITSKFLDEKIQNLQNMIDVESKLLESSITGQKESILENLKQKLIYAEQLYDFSRINYERSLTLMKDSVIPQSEFDIAKTSYENSKTAIEIAKSEYEVAKTGVKPEDVKLIEERISSYAKEMNFYSRMKNDYVLISPISGKIVIDLYSMEPVEFISITDTSEYILYSPIKNIYRLYLKPESKTEFSIPGTNITSEAELLEIGSNAEFIFTNQVVFTILRIKDPSDNIYPGLTVQIKFTCDEITLWEYAQRSISIFFK